MRYDADELARENEELRHRTERDEWREAKEWEEQQEQRRAEAEDKYSAMRMTGRAPDGSRVTERSLDEVFARASDAADHDDAIEEQQRIIREQRGGWVEPIDHDADLRIQRMKFDRDYIRRVAKDPAKIAEMERELELRSRDMERYLWQRNSVHRPY